MDSHRIENPQSETAMNTDRHSTRSHADHGRIADQQPETRRKLPYEAPRLRGHAKLPVITAGSISEKSWRFGEVDGDSQDL